MSNETCKYMHVGYSIEGHVHDSACGYERSGELPPFCPRCGKLIEVVTDLRTTIDQSSAPYGHVHDAKVVRAPTQTLTGVQACIEILFAAIDTATPVELRNVMGVCNERSVDPSVPARERWMYRDMAQILRRTLR